MGVGDVSLGYQYRDTRHSSSHHCNVDQGHHGRDCVSWLSSGLDEDFISDDISLGVYTDDGRGGLRYQETNQSSSRNSIVYRICYRSGDDGICGFLSQDTRNSSFLNCLASVDGDGRVGYRSHTSHSNYHNRGGSGRLLGSSVYSHPVQNVFIVMR